MINLSIENQGHLNPNLILKDKTPKTIKVIWDLLKKLKET